MAAVRADGTECRFGHLTLSEDPFVHRLTADQAHQAVEAALAAGQAAADMATTTWGRNPAEIAASLKVPVTRDAEPARTGRSVLFSEYGNRPPSIIVHTHSVAEANRLIREHDLASVVGLTDVGPVHLTHELYHHLEDRRLTPGTAGFRIQTGRLGPIRFRSGLPTLSEIAADRFAAAVLRLQVPPKALGFLTVYVMDSSYAWSLLARLREFPA
jgi:hypothetical protein